MVLVARRKEAIADTAERILAAGGQATFLQADATQFEDARRAVVTTVDQYGRLDILYNNAGGGYARQGEGTSLLEMGEAFWDQIITNNLRSAYLCSRQAIPVIVRQGGGVILNVAADFTVRQRGTVAYGAAKNGIIGFTQNLARECLALNIRVNCLCPGLIREPLREGAVMPRCEPLARRGSPEDVAYAALFLVSDEACWITGQVLAVDGGNEVRVDIG